MQDIQVELDAAHAAVRKNAAEFQQLSALCNRIRSG